jgi:mannose-1-phosphate guanylyltransferase/mannose-6-phosphate isomerase
MYSVILCGGSGTRLWPFSRKNFAKQFLSFYGDQSLLQEAFSRIHEIMPKERIFFVTNQDNFFNVFNQIKEIEPKFRREQIIIEPASMNTAPAIALAVKHLLEVEKISDEAPIIFLYSDHYISNRITFLAKVKQIFKEVGDNIGTLGITPVRPETGYGYIKKGKKLNGLYKVAEFKEKPDKKTAEKYLASGQYVWNSGMYIFNARAFERELTKHAPEIFNSYKTDLKIFRAEFKNLPLISIDYAISEKSDRVVVLEGEFGWKDIGSFDGLAEIYEQEGIEHQPRHVSIDSKNIFIYSASDLLVATIGVEDLVIVENRDSILVQKRGRGEDVKKIVEQLKEQDYKELEHNIIVHRPWGKFEVLVDEEKHKVKKLTVYPGGRLSLQLHRRRSEHWVVVKGEATVINGDKEIVLRENESTYIPVSTKHRLANAGDSDLEVIEVQTGDYFGEDDIERFDDVYHRV